MHRARSSLLENDKLNMGPARLYFRAIAVWFFIMVVESVHGTLRELFLTPWIGDLRARQISFFTGLTIIFFITFFLIRWIGFRRRRDLILIGILWACLTFCFEIAIGIMAIGLTWDQVIADYDVSQGRLMAVGLLAMSLIPLIANEMRGKGVE